MQKENYKRKQKRKKKVICILILSIILFFGIKGVYLYMSKLKGDKVVGQYDIVPQENIEDMDNVLEPYIPDYNGEPYVIINDNVPLFESDEISPVVFEHYSQLDDLGRCGVTFACVGQETMPTEERGEIGHVRPSGWNQAKYFGVVDSKPPYLYNRCHLIAFCLTGENDNVNNLITGTRYMNVEGMLPWEEMVAKYVDETDNHVLYRVTPDFREEELLARGVLIEAYSVEDNGQGICICVYCYNIQPGVVIDYKNGESCLEQ